MSAFTPGPWRIEPSDWNSDACRDSVSVVDSEGTFVAQAWTDFEAEADDVQLFDGLAPYGTGTANAHLIAAAPDLLAAAKATITRADAMCPGDVMDTHELEAAIAKAEGR